MPITFVAAGAKAEAASGNITPALPTGWAADDILIVVCTQKDNVVSTITAGWTIFGAANNGTACRSLIAWKRAVGGETAPTITHTAGNAIVGAIAAFRGCITTGDPAEVKGTPRANASSATVTADAITPLTADSMLCFAAHPGDNGTQSAWSGTNPTFGTPAFDVNTALGLDAAAALNYGIKTDTTTTGSRTCTTSLATENIGTLFTLKPPAAAAGRARPPVVVRQAVNRGAVW